MHPRQITRHKAEQSSGPSPRRPVNPATLSSSLRPHDACPAVWLLIRSQPRLDQRGTSMGSAQVTETHVHAKAAISGIRPKYTPSSPLVDQNVAHPTWFRLIVNPRD